MKHITTITIPKTKGKKPIHESEDIFTGWVDNDFLNYGLTDTEPARDEVTLDVKELTEDMTFGQMFTDPEHQWLTQEQVIESVKNIDTNFAHFFLLKKDSDFFVAHVRRDGGGLYADVRRFSRGRVWRAERRPRVVVPATGHSEPKSGDTLTLEPLDKELQNAIATVKQAGYKVIKEM